MNDEELFVEWSSAWKDWQEMQRDSAVCKVFDDCIATLKKAYPDSKRKGKSKTDARPLWR
eukprot:2212950-Karenia_brevis.AAC.1